MVRLAKGALVFHFTFRSFVDETRPSRVESGQPLPASHFADEMYGSTVRRMLSRDIALLTRTTASCSVVCHPQACLSLDGADGVEEEDPLELFGLEGDDECGGILSGLFTSAEGDVTAAPVMALGGHAHFGVGQAPLPRTHKAGGGHGKHKKSGGAKSGAAKKAASGAAKAKAGGKARAPQSSPAASHGAPLSRAPSAQRLSTAAPDVSDASAGGGAGAGRGDAPAAAPPLVHSPAAASLPPHLAGLLVARGAGKRAVKPNLLLLDDAQRSAAEAAAAEAAEAAAAVAAVARAQARERAAAACAAVPPRHGGEAEVAAPPVAVCVPAGAAADVPARLPRAFSLVPRPDAPARSLKRVDRERPTTTAGRAALKRAREEAAAAAAGAAAASRAPEETLLPLQLLLPLAPPPAPRQLSAPAGCPSPPPRAAACAHPSPAAATDDGGVFGVRVCDDGDDSEVPALPGASAFSDGAGGGHEYADDAAGGARPPRDPVSGLQDDAAAVFGAMLMGHDHAVRSHQHHHPPPPVAAAQPADDLQFADACGQFGLL